ncbi:expressed unknown protein [Ectocarpus siliculosus]|uniref:Uncharacterized protein n=1 Tax=Ectocarpus siliculosus TaxID=2880 RepID=D8LGJ8_ECTSI|nr:expressed unknown protein [Ectocarpus siliculosus]|eukprot:CBN79055.1 expressed unknown protein [Ectocarpus siliculosus]
MKGGAAQQSSQISANALPDVGGAAWAFVVVVGALTRVVSSSRFFLAGGWEEPESAWQWREDPRQDRQSGWYL